MSLSIVFVVRCSIAERRRLPSSRACSLQNLSIAGRRFFIYGSTQVDAGPNPGQHHTQLAPLSVTLHISL